MKLKLVYERTSGKPVDIVVTADPTATVGDVASSIAATDPMRQNRPNEGLTLSAIAPDGGGAVPIPADRPMNDAPIASGFTIRLLSAASVPLMAKKESAVTVRVVDGPDRDREYSLPDGSYVIGRDPSADIVLNDPLVSKQHARMEVDGDVELVDQNSANGIVVDGSHVTRLAVQSGRPVTIGGSVLTFTTAQPVGTRATANKVTAGAIPFNRSPKVEPRYPEKQHPRPAAPSEPEPPMFAWIMLFAPIAMGIAMYSFTGRVMSLMFVAMAPMMMTGNYLNNRYKNKRQSKSELAKFDAQVKTLENTLDAETKLEGMARRREVPTVAEVLDVGYRNGPDLWTRRPEHWSFLALRLGTATLPSRNTVAAPPEIDEAIPELSQRVADIEARYRTVQGVPVLESGPLAGAIGVAGPEGVAAARGLLVQLAGMHAPTELVITAIIDPAEVRDWDWLRWLPHTSSSASPIESTHLADTQPTAAQLIAELERLVAERSGRGGEAPPEFLGPMSADLAATGVPGQLGDVELAPAAPLPVIVVVISEDAPVDKSRILQIASRASAVGILPVWIARTNEALPAVCRTFIDTTRGLNASDVHFVRHGEVVGGVVVEGVSVTQADTFARALAPLHDVSAVTVDSTDLPNSVSMVTLLGDDLAESSAAVVDRWRQNLSMNSKSGKPEPRQKAGTLRSLVGQMGADAMHLDLRTQGPHALVGGTTGAGKSEFLQAWVLGMAAEYAPDRVTFLFVDYKGGAAFAECVRLPHCVGLVTDLSPHLVRRALTSLRAELHYREHLLNRKKAKDLLELEKRGDPEAPPALVLVIDEFAALSKDVPDFVDGVVDIAQRGRSLGIHLIMATQRPAGVIKDNLRANTNLRIALRMADESDSADVIDTPVAAHFDPSIPGRAIAKSGPGRLTPFQSAYAGGHTSTDARTTVDVLVQTLRFGAAEPWTRPEVAAPAVIEDPGPTDQVRLVESIIAASSLAQLAAPRKPWLEELRTAYDLARLGPLTDTELVLGLSDLPHQQDQKVGYFRPDEAGNLAVYGTSGAGKSVLLRTLAVGAGVTPLGGPVQVYCLDFAAGGLRILEPLPQVGAVVSGDDHERVTRLLRTLRTIADERARAFPAVNAGNITEYRELAGRPDEPRILLLLDNFAAFRETYEVVGPRQATYAILSQLLSEGRALGIHVVFTADRPASIPGSIAASVPKRVVMRLADDTGYLVLGVPNDILDVASPPGRAVIDGYESQVAIFGGSGNVADQSRAIGEIARAMRAQGLPEAPPVMALPFEILEGGLPAEIDGRPVLGISDDTLEPIGFDPEGTFLIGGGPGSGRTNAVVALARSLRRWKPDVVLVYFGLRRSVVPDMLEWNVVATTPEDVADAAKQLTEALGGPTRKVRTVVVIEGLSDFLGSPADASLVALIKTIKRSEHLLIADSETSSWTSMPALFSEIRNGRRGILLQPDATEGDTILRTSFPRSRKVEFPPGRGMAVLHGSAVKVQLPLADSGSSTPA